MFGAIMFASDIAMEALPNIHLIGVFTVLLTSIFRIRALIPLYVYVFITGLFSGFSMWWIPYLYIWLPLWALAMLVPKRAPRAVKAVVYPLITALHGFAFGVLYAPAQAIMFGLDLDGMIAWIIAGIPFDLTHGISNLCLGLLILPMSELFTRILRKSRFYS